MPKLTALFLYPVKALRGFAVQEASFDALGLVGDRRFLVVDPQGRFLTQRTQPRMARLATALQAGHLVLSDESGASLEVPLQASEPCPTLKVSVWSASDLLAEDCGDKAAAWLSQRLGQNCRLVRAGAAYDRRIPSHRLPPRSDPAPEPSVSFADAFPFLLLNQSSVEDLNRRLVEKGAEALPVNRFRTNLLVEGLPAYAEDAFPRWRLGAHVFLSAGPCARCAVTCTDQNTGERGTEPLATLASYRRDSRKPKEVNFGLNLLASTPTGQLRVGDPVEGLA